MKPPGSLKDIEMLHLALSSMPGGRANSPDIVTWLMNHQIQIRWINPDVNELRSCINNALFRALRGNQPKVIAHQPQWPKKAQSIHLVYIVYSFIFSTPMDRVCSSCPRIDPPQWRFHGNTGERLCNACGLREARARARSKTALLTYGILVIAIIITTSSMAFGLWTLDKLLNPLN